MKSWAVLPPNKVAVMTVLSSASLIFSVSVLLGSASVGGAAMGVGGTKVGGDVGVGGAEVGGGDVGVGMGAQAAAARTTTTIVGLWRRPAIVALMHQGMIEGSV